MQPRAASATITLTPFIAPPATIPDRSSFVHDVRARWVAELMKTSYRPDPASYDRAQDILGDYEKCMMAMLSPGVLDPHATSTFSKRMCDCRDIDCTAKVHDDFKKAVAGKPAAPEDPGKTRSVINYVECLTIMSKHYLRGAPAE
ncbi:MAG: hypothetical protein SFX73_34200 [Kofleriaceae bacterium]|nr:hypothetical protein [Kofleriaceae bacterium]